MSINITNTDPVFAMNRSVTHDFTGKGRDKGVTLSVTSGSVHIKLSKKNKFQILIDPAIHDQDYATNIQGYSDFLDTTVDTSNWQVTVSGNALSIFSLSLPN